MSDSLASDPPFTPADKRESSKVSFGDYLWKLLKTVIITKVAAVAGALVGDKVGGRNGAAVGYFMAGISTAAYEGHQHWKPIKGTQRRLEEIMPEVAVELNPETLQEEVTLQKEIHEGLAARQKLFTAMEKKRESKPIEPRGSAVDAVTKEPAAEPGVPLRS